MLVDDRRDRLLFSLSLDTCCNIYKHLCSIIFHPAPCCFFFAKARAFVLATKCSLRTSAELINSCTIQKRIFAVLLISTLVLIIISIRWLRFLNLEQSCSMRLLTPSSVLSFASFLRCLFVVYPICWGGNATTFDNDLSRPRENVLLLLKASVFVAFSFSLFSVVFRRFFPIIVDWFIQRIVRTKNEPERLEIDYPRTFTLYPSILRSLEYRLTNSRNNIIPNTTLPKWTKKCAFVFEVVFSRSDRIDHLCRLKGVLHATHGFRHKESNAAQTLPSGLE